jgi:hypothetical protein
MGPKHAGGPWIVVTLAWMGFNAYCGSSATACFCSLHTLEVQILAEGALFLLS